MNVYWVLTIVMERQLVSTLLVDSTALVTLAMLEMERTAQVML